MYHAPEYEDRWTLLEQSYIAGEGKLSLSKQERMAWARDGYILTKSVVPMIDHSIPIREDLEWLRVVTHYGKKAKPWTMSSS
jgi:hypothetical protein|tara:strand:- start:368 stop:613 length:246 start_codon:yes stop_codon:yes gene_type:complete